MAAEGGLSKERGFGVWAFGLWGFRALGVWVWALGFTTTVGDFGFRVLGFRVQG